MLPSVKHSVHQNRGLSHYPEIPQKEKLTVQEKRTREVEGQQEGEISERDRPITLSLKFSTCDFNVNEIIERQKKERQKKREIQMEKYNDQIFIDQYGNRISLDLPLTPLGDPELCDLVDHQYRDRHDDAPEVMNTKITINPDLPNSEPKVKGNVKSPEPVVNNREIVLRDQDSSDGCCSSVDCSPSKGTIVLCLYMLCWAGLFILFFVFGKSSNSTDPDYGSGSGSPGGDGGGGRSGI